MLDGEVLQRGGRSVRGELCAICSGSSERSNVAGEAHSWRAAAATLAALAQLLLFTQLDQLTSVWKCPHNFDTIATYWIGCVVPLQGLSLSFSELFIEPRRGKRAISIPTIFPGSLISSS